MLVCTTFMTSKQFLGDGVRVLGENSVSRIPWKKSAKF
jgi:hypothetical protein